MTEIIMRILNASTYVSAIFIIVIGCAVVLCLLLYPIWYLLNTVLYKKTKASLYFVSYVRYRKEFIKWFDETNPKVYKPKIKE